MLNLVGLFGKEITVDGVAKWLEANGGKPFTVYLDSNGGSMEVAMAIDAMLQNEPVEKVEIKQAHSAASYIAAGIANRVKAPSVKDGDDIMMVHSPHLPKVPVDATADDLRVYADVLDEYEDVLAKRYVDGFGFSEQEARAMMKKETWINTEAAKRLNVVAFAKPQPKNDMSKLDELFASIRNLVKAEAEPAEEMTVEQYKEKLLEAETKMAAMATELDQYKAKVAALEEASDKVGKDTEAALAEIKAEVEAMAKDKAAANARAAAAEAKVEAMAKANPKPAVVETPSEDLSKLPEWKKQMAIAKRKAEQAM